MAGGFLGEGLSFPVRPAPGGGLYLADGVEKVRQSIWLILSTAEGERVMRPDFGCGIHDLVFEANTPALRALVTQKVRNALVTWEPRIDVLEVSAESAPDQRNCLLIQVDYRLRTNNAMGNLVYPFYLQEQGA